MAKQLAVIIGVGPGLGLALVNKFHSEGFDICMIARNKSKLESFANQITEGPGKVFSYSADAGNDSSLQSTLKEILDKHGIPDLLIYNVSLLRPARPMDISYKSFVEDFQINVGGLLSSFQSVFPSMKDKNKGTFLITGGGLSLIPFYEFTSLGVGKAGLRNLAVSLAQEAKKTGVRVFSITVNGMIEPKSKFDPELIADKFVEIYEKGLTPGEYEFIYQ